MTSMYFTEKKTAGVVTLLCLGFILISSSSSVRENVVNQADRIVDQPGDSVICKSISGSEIEKTIGPTSGKIIVSLYPVKKTPGLQQNDYSFFMKYSKSGGKNNSSKKTKRNKMNDQQSYNYFRSLKEGLVPEHLIPVAYFFEIDLAQVKKNIDLCMFIKKGKPVFFESKSGYNIMSVSRDSCKCPPTCPCYETLLEETYAIKGAIKKAYQKN